MSEAHTVKVEWTPVIKEGGKVIIVTSDTKQLFGVVNAEVNRGLGKSADSFTLKLFDTDGSEEDYWYKRVDQGDLIKIYSSLDGGSSWRLELDGTVNQVRKKINVDDRYVTITGLNRLESLLGLITPVAGGVGGSFSADYWIRQIIREVNTQNGYARYTGDDSGSVSVLRADKYLKGGLLSEWRAVGNDETTKTFGATFVKGDQPAFVLIENLSAAEYAGGLHLFYLDTNNYFHWHPLSSTLAGSLPVNDSSTTIDHQNYDAYNYVIVKAGKNLYGNANIITFKYDLLEATKNGIKATVKYFDGINATVRQELRRKLINDRFYSDSSFPFSTSYPFTTPSSWSNPKSVSSDAELNSAFVDEVLVRADDAAQAALSSTASADIKESYVVPVGEGFSDFELGAYYSDVFTGKNLRVDRRVLSFRVKNGWSLNLHLVEDVDKVNS